MHVWGGERLQLLKSQRLVSFIQYTYAAAGIELQGLFYWFIHYSLQYCSCQYLCMQHPALQSTQSEMLSCNKLSVTSAMDPRLGKALPSSCALITLTISIEFDSRSSKLTKAMTSFRSSESCGLKDGVPVQSSELNKIFSDVAMPATQTFDESFPALGTCTLE